MTTQTRSVLPRLRKESPSFGEQLIEAMQEALAIERGEKEPARVHVYEMPEGFRRAPSWVRGRRERGGRNRLSSPYVRH